MLIETAENNPVAVMLLILMCGSRESGLTTTISDLGERLKSDVVPGRHDDSGVTFDSMKHTGGRHAGQPIQTQLVTHPQITPPEVRRRLVDGANAVLFVADTTRTGVGASTEEFRKIEQAVTLSPEPQPIIIVQANKRDAHDAIGLDEVKSVFNENGDRIVIETIATTGDGVRQAFVYAVRKGLENLTTVNINGSGDFERSTANESRDSSDMSEDRSYLGFESNVGETISCKSTQQVGNGFKLAEDSESNLNSGVDGSLSDGFTIKAADMSSQIGEKTPDHDAGLLTVDRGEQTSSERSQGLGRSQTVGQEISPARRPDVSGPPEPSAAPVSESNILTRFLRFFEGS